ncbi:holo-[acyl-carrier-protein] synthase [Polytolypa hystricis UAMH7299]|uniref:Holo-[acyl-carrier-protein] synthase n=1 Tax=Polytolypa hystricis (strain UAMH7299) TaxID=1447883 RepID=A0A2B7Y1K2_POLH7|nr:holo-[acyl-carrier-protein] synthase [Polytolypa hystricis UAMH7299]
MKLAPFPFALNVGTDIVHLPRIIRLINRPASQNSQGNAYLNRFTRRILCDQEQNAFRVRFGDLDGCGEKRSPTQTTEIARWLAGRFASKEAAKKAAPGGAAAVGWKDVMVRVESNGSGRPEVIYLKEGGSRGELGKLSISHDGDYVIATVIAASPNG